MAEDTFVVDVNPHGEPRTLLCDGDVLPIRKQVAAILEGEDPPMEWLCLPNVEAVQATYQSLRDCVHERKRFEAEGLLVPVKVQEFQNRYRWKLVCLVTEAYFGDRKYRAAGFWKLSSRELRETAKKHCIKGYSRMSKEQLVEALVDADLSS